MLKGFKKGDEEQLSVYGSVESSSQAQEGGMGESMKVLILQVNKRLTVCHQGLTGTGSFSLHGECVDR